MVNIKGGYEKWQKNTLEGTHQGITLPGDSQMLKEVLLPRKLGEPEGRGTGKMVCVAETRTGIGARAGVNVSPDIWRQ